MKTTTHDHTDISAIAAMAAAAAAAAATAASAAGGTAAATVVVAALVNSNISIYLNLMVQLCDVILEVNFFMKTATFCSNFSTLLDHPFYISIR